MSDRELSIERYIRLSAWQADHWREMNSKDYVRLSPAEFTADCSRQATLQHSTRIALSELLREAPELGMSVSEVTPPHRAKLTNPGNV